MALPPAVASSWHREAVAGQVDMGAAEADLRDQRVEATREGLARQDAAAALLPGDVDLVFAGIHTLRLKMMSGHGDHSPHKGRGCQVKGTASVSRQGGALDSCCRRRDANRQTSRGSRAGRLTLRRRDRLAPRASGLLPRLPERGGLPRLPEGRRAATSAALILGTASNTLTANKQHQSD